MNKCVFSLTIAVTRMWRDRPNETEKRINLLRVSARIRLHSGSIVSLRHTPFDGHAAPLHIDSVNVSGVLDTHFII